MAQAAEDLKTISGQDGVPKDSPDAASVPVPTVRIDNEHDPFATIVCISYGDRLGEVPLCSTLGVLLGPAPGLLDEHDSIGEARVADSSLSASGQMPRDSLVSAPAVVRCCAAVHAAGIAG